MNRQPTPRLRLPAFGKAFIGRPCAWLRLGHTGMTQASLEARGGARNILAIPPGEQPASIDWTLLAGLDVVVIEHDDQGPDYRLAVMRALARAGVNIGYLIPASRRREDYILIGIRPRHLGDKEAA